MVKIQKSSYPMHATKNEKWKKKKCEVIVEFALVEFHARFIQESEKQQISSSVC